MTNTNSELGLGIARIIRILIQRCGSLRGAAKFTDISRTAFSKLRDGETLYPESYTLQKLEVALKKLNPSLTDPETGATLVYSWIELDVIAENQRQAVGITLKSKSHQKDNPLDKTEDIKQQVAYMRKQIDFLLGQLQATETWSKGENRTDESIRQTTLEVGSSDRVHDVLLEPTSSSTLAFPQVQIGYVLK